MWHSLKEISISEEGEISARVDIPPDSEWFSGHFPGDPILPGIAQIDAVNDLIGRVLGGNSTCISRLNRIRFKKIIRPGDQLEIKTSAVGTGTESVSFSILASGEIVCNGTMTVSSDQSL